MSHLVYIFQIGIIWWVLNCLWKIQIFGDHVWEWKFRKSHQVWLPYHYRCWYAGTKCSAAGPQSQWRYIPKSEEFLKKVKNSLKKWIFIQKYEYSFKKWIPYSKIWAYTKIKMILKNTSEIKWIFLQKIYTFIKNWIYLYKKTLFLKKMKISKSGHFFNSGESEWNSALPVKPKCEWNTLFFYKNDFRKTSELKVAKN